MWSRLRTRWYTCVVLLLLPIVGLQANTPVEQYVARANAAMAAKDYRLARAYLDPVAIAANLSHRDRAKVYLQRARSFLAEGHFRSAVLDLRHALQFDPSNGDTATALAFLYARGQGVKRDDGEAARLFIKAARQGNTIAQRNIGVMYLNGLVSDERNLTNSSKKARYWLHQAASANDTEAMVYLANNLWRDLDEKTRDSKQALVWLEKAAALSFAPAWLELGHLYHSDRLGGLPDPLSGNRFYDLALKAGLPGAASAIAYQYQHGQGRRRDLKAAVALYEQAARAGDAYGQTQLAWHYQEGAYLRKDLGQAAYWYERAASQGDLWAKVLLAQLLLTADPVTAADERARGWELLESAAASGQAVGLNALAWWLATSSIANERDGDRAINLAQSALKLERTASYMDTLAAALAERGDFEEARLTLSEAIALAEHTEPNELRFDPELLADLKTRLANYQANQPWRE